MEKEGREPLRIALFSDIHGNLTGLRAVLAYLDRQWPADALVCAGDLLGGGPGTEEVLDLLIERRVHTVLGNHDQMALDVESGRAFIPEDAWQLFAPEYAWLHTQIAQPFWDWLASRPLALTFELGGDGRQLFVCHAAPDDTWARVCAADNPLELLEETYGAVPAEVVAYGHYHEPHVLKLEDKTLLNVASVGMRNDGHSALTLLEADGQSLEIRQVKVPYDVREERRLMREKGFRRAERYGRAGAHLEVEGIRAAG